MKKILLSGMLLLSSHVFAEPIQLIVDSAHTFPQFEIDHFGISNQRGNFTNTTGTILLDYENKKADVNINIKTDSVNTGLKALEDHLRSRDFLDSKKFPEMTFKSTQTIFDGDKIKKINGNLTIKNITKPVTLEVTQFNKKLHPFTHKTVYGAEAFTFIKRTDFDIKYGLPALSNNVKIILNIEAFENKSK